MNEQAMKVVLGALLHDIGKILYRQGDDSRRHSKSGYDYLKSTVKIEDSEVLSCVRYHHARELSSSKIENDSIAYIVYMADNMASAIDRRKSEDDTSFGFDAMTPLQPVFNRLNENVGEKYYTPFNLNEKEGINYPQNEKTPFTKGDYTKILLDITEHLKGMEWSVQYINSLIEIMEADLSYVPSSTSTQEVPDISLFDHVKLTAAIASCLLEYLKAGDNTNYRERLFDRNTTIHTENVFLLASMDISGIQKFIYTINTKEALRTLRARSFYLEILMEHIIDTLLDRIGLSRANRIYAGGGHCYILLPNTDEVIRIFNEWEEEINVWFLDVFGDELYIAGGLAQLSSNSMQNTPIGSYSEVFRRVSDEIGKKKLHRYSAKQIISLNTKEEDDYTRECKVCRRLGGLNDDDVCDMCSRIKLLSEKVLYADFFAVSSDEKQGVPLPGNLYLTAGNEEYVRELQERDQIKIYAKNKRYTGKYVSTKLWVGDYTIPHATFEVYAKEAEGIDRIGVLRADVDDLGKAFIAGFDNLQNNNRYVTISRTATLSRQLSLFFKYYINRIFDEKHRRLTIIYSGGDDVFLVGAWNDVLYAAIDLHEALEKYTDNTLTISAGYGIYASGYPISVIADEVGKKESKSKSESGKNSITILDDKTYKWDELIKGVLGEKYKTIERFFDESDERGKTFIYNLLDLIRHQDERINYARFFYFLARMEPSQGDGKEKLQEYREFSGKMIKWIQDDKDRGQLDTAMTLYVYKTRGEEGDNE